MQIANWSRRSWVSAGICLGLAGPAGAYTIIVSSSQFTQVSVFNSLKSFQFEIDVNAPLAPGNYSNPPLGVVTYSVFGTLGSPTPSNFPAFALERTFASGADFYAQGSSLQFAIAPGANLADGLQLSDLAGNGEVFIFNGHETDTGRYHPPLLTLFGDGTGTIQNSDNMGGVNVSTGNVVNVDFGQEYIVNLSTNPATMTLAVPEPSEALMLLAGLMVLGVWCRRR